MAWMSGAWEWREKFSRSPKKQAENLTVNEITLLVHAGVSTVIVEIREDGQVQEDNPQI